MDYRKLNDSELIKEYSRMIDNGIKSQVCWIGKNLLEREIEKRNLNT